MKPMLECSLLASMDRCRRSKLIRILPRILAEESGTGKAVGVTGVSTQIRRRPGAHFQTIRYILLRARARKRARHPGNDLLLR